jgi:hypothetical protein
VPPSGLAPWMVSLQSPCSPSWLSISGDQAADFFGGAIAAFTVRVVPRFKLDFLSGVRGRCLHGVVLIFSASGGSSLDLYRWADFDRRRHCLVIAVHLVANVTLKTTIGA